MTMTTSRACQKDVQKDGGVDEPCGLDFLETSGEVPTVFECHPPLKDTGAQLLEEPPYWGTEEQRCR